MEGLVSDVILVYTSPAWPFDNISMIKSYQLGKDAIGDYIYDGVEVKYYKYELIKAIFTPKEKTWEEIDNPKAKTKK